MMVSTITEESGGYVKDQQHLVFGAGLIGCYLGACLAESFSTTLVCRDRIRQRLTHGIHLTDYLGNKLTTKNLKFAQQSDSLIFDVIWLTVKCTAVAQACNDMAQFVSPNTVILCAQNGLGSEHIVKQAFPNNAVLRVMVPFNVVELQEGHFHRGSEGQLTIESTNELQVQVANWVGIIDQPLLPVVSSANMNAVLWAKLQLNLGNSVNALANVPVKEMLEQRGYRLIIAAMMDELLTVTQQLGIPLPKLTSLPAHWLPVVLRLPDFLFKRIANKMLAIDPEVRTSMWWDINNGKKTEIEFLNGAIIENCTKLGLRAPVNQKVVSLIRLLEDKGREHLPQNEQALTAAILG